MDELNMAKCYNWVRDKENPMSLTIPDNAIWTWNEGGYFGLSGSDNEYLYVYQDNSSNYHIAVGSEGTVWKPTWDSGGKYYNLYSGVNTSYYQFCRYWNFSVWTGARTDKNAKVNIYEQTTVYLDEKPTNS